MHTSPSSFVFPSLLPPSLPPFLHPHPLPPIIISVINNVFLVSPSSQTVTEGDTVALFCVQGGSLPPATIAWTFNGAPLVTSSRITLQFSQLYNTNPQQVSSSLFVSPVQKNDSGVYRCVATNPLLPSSPVTSDGGVLTVQGTFSRPALSVM